MYRYNSCSTPKCNFRKNIIGYRLENFGCCLRVGRSALLLHWSFLFDLVCVCRGDKFSTVFEIGSLLRFQWLQIPGQVVSHQILFQLLVVGFIQRFADVVTCCLQCASPCVPRGAPTAPLCFLSYLIKDTCSCRNGRVGHCRFRSTGFIIRLGGHIFVGCLSSRFREKSIFVGPLKTWYTDVG